MSEWKKVGRCNRCGFCCLINHCAVKVGSGEVITKVRDRWRIVKDNRKEGTVFMARWDPCQYLSFDKKCELHGTKYQPAACREFPDRPNDFYTMIKKKCSIKFVKVKE